MQKRRTLTDWFAIRLGRCQDRNPDADPHQIEQPGQPAQGSHGSPAAAMAYGPRPLSKPPTR